MRCEARLDRLSLPARLRRTGALPVVLTATTRLADDAFRIPQGFTEDDGRMGGRRVLPVVGARAR